MASQQNLNPTVSLQRLKFFCGDDPTPKDLPKSVAVLRRSGRKSCQQNRSEALISKLIEVDSNDSNLPLKVKEFVGKGRGIVATSTIPNGNFVVEYAGDLITQGEGNKILQSEEDFGSYIYYFKFQDKPFW